MQASKALFEQVPPHCELTEHESEALFEHWPAPQSEATEQTDALLEHVPLQVVDTLALVQITPASLAQRPQSESPVHTVVAPFEQRLQSLLTLHVLAVLVEQRLTQASASEQAWPPVEQVPCGSAQLLGPIAQPLVFESVQAPPEQMLPIDVPSDA